MGRESKTLEEPENTVYENKFELIAIASQRARDLRAGRKALLPANSEKEPVLALREVLSGELVVEVVRDDEDENAEGP